MYFNIDKMTKQELRELKAQLDTMNLEEPRYKKGDIIGTPDNKSYLLATVCDHDGFKNFRMILILLGKDRGNRFNDKGIILPFIRGNYITLSELNSCLKSSYQEEDIVILKPSSLSIAAKGYSI